MEKIGLFPLNLVLFPESVLPLHIFEERYKRLINMCYEQAISFGINLVASDKIYDVGCTADVTDIVNKYDDGKLDIIVEGIKRYRIISFEQTEEPYNEAYVEFFEDDNSSIDETVLIECIKIYNKIADTIVPVNIKKLNLSLMEVFTPSFLIAQKAGMTVIQKQKLLEITSENERLTMLLGHLESLLPMLKESETMARVILNDGYLVNRRR